MEQFSYNSDLNGGSLMVRESRIIADLILKKAAPEEWEREILLKNALQKRSPATAKRNAQAIRKRLELMEPDFLTALRDGDDELASQVAFAAALVRNLLLVEFMETVVKDAYVTRMERIELYQWEEFLEDCSNKDPLIEGWKESTRKKMGQVVFRMLAEAGYLRSTRSLEYQSVRIRPELRVLLEENYKHRIKDCMEVACRAAA